MAVNVLSSTDIVLKALQAAKDNCIIVQTVFIVISCTFLSVVQYTCGLFRQPTSRSVLRAAFPMFA